MEQEEFTFPILGIDHIELYVGSATHASRFFCDTFGFSEIADSGLETGNKENVSRVLAQGNVRLVLTGALENRITVDKRGRVEFSNEVAEHVAKHGDGVKDIALHVPQCRAAYVHALARGARAIMSPTAFEDEHGLVLVATIGTYGDTVHSLVERKDYRGVFMPGYRPTSTRLNGAVGILNVDHIVGNVELGRMDHWAKFYSDVMGFTNLVHFTDDQISTEFTALMSKVMWDGIGKVKFPINEPAASSKKKSQIDEFLQFYDGAGVQHIALETEDIVDTVSKLVARGVKFLDIPQVYYEEVRQKFSDVPEVEVGKLQKYGILADRDEEGYLLQIFTKPIVDRPTLFFELIERHGSRGFGKGNFKALFEAIERDQEKRGTLVDK